MWMGWENKMNGHEVDYCPECLHPTGCDAMMITSDGDSPHECSNCGYTWYPTEDSLTRMNLKQRLGIFDRGCEALK